MSHPVDPVIVYPFPGVYSFEGAANVTSKSPCAPSCADLAIAWIVSFGARCALESELKAVRCVRGEGSMMRSAAAKCYRSKEEEEEEEEEEEVEGSEMV